MEDDTSGFWIFLVIILAITTIWFWNQNDKLKNQVETLQKRITTYEKNIPNANCTRVWDGSIQKFVDRCKKTKSETLSDCSKSSGKSISELSTSNMTIEKIEKARELLMRTCMQNAGFDY